MMHVVNLIAPENFGVPLWAAFGPERAPSLVCVKFVFSDGAGPFVESVHGGALLGMATMFESHLPMLASEWAEKQNAVYFRAHNAALTCIRERTAAPSILSTEARVTRPIASNPVLYQHVQRRTIRGDIR